jgi:hypothetical protein
VTLAEMITSDIPRLFETAEFAQTVTYTPTTGDAVSGIPAIVRRTGEEEKNSTVQFDARIRLRVSDVAARPAHGATIAATDAAGETETWELVANATSLRGTWLCKCVRGRRPGFRR